MADQESLDNQHFFYEDEVYRISKNGRVCLGMVLENFEANFSDQDSDSDIPQRLTPVKKGELRVSWHPTGREEVVRDATVGLADRSLMPGDVVRRMIKGKDTQRGYCREINVQVAAQMCGTPFVIANITSERLKPLEDFASDLAVCLDSWVGSTRNVNSHMIVTSTDGSKIQWNDLYNCPFDEYTTSKTRIDSSETAKLYYPGQIVVSSLKALESAEWIHCTKEMTTLRKKKHKEHKFVIQSIDTDSVSVRWQCKALSFESEGGHEGAHTQPKSIIEGEDLKRLKLLNLFEPCTVSVGDRYYLTVTENDIVTNISDWKKKQSREFKEMHRAKAALENESPDKKSALNLDLNGTFENSEIETIDEENVERNGISENKTNGEDVTKTENTKNSGNAEETAEIDSDADWLTDSSGESIATHSTQSSESVKRTKKPPVLSTKLLKGKKLKRTKRKAPVPQPPKPGDKIVVEIISTKSKADVVWQDGCIEHCIESINLYPIHHLDDQEFFPGDFVIAGTDGPDPPSLRRYGVVQSMDHLGRTALVKWFQTYTSIQEPRPAFLSENEVSVYDLKDHPDFQYRPATIVIRVANFIGEDSNCTAGQVIDNFPEGKVRVWWVDGHTSMCWPQDIFKIGEYDSEDGDFWADDISDDSWETQSEESVSCASSVGIPCAVPELKPRLAANVERARTAMARLEEIFTQNPSLQSQEVMRKLLDVYKECRYLDRLMDTSFFHEDHFQGLLERVREKGTANAAKQIQDHMSRLFSNEFEESFEMNNSNASNEEVLIESTDLETNSTSKNESKHRDSKHCLESKSSSKTNIIRDEWVKKKNSKTVGRSSSSTVQNQVSKVNSNTDIAQKNSKSSLNDNSINKNEINRSSKCDIPAVPNNSLNDVKIPDNDDVKASLDTVKLVIQRMNVEQNESDETNDPINNTEAVINIKPIDSVDTIIEPVNNLDKENLKMDEIQVINAEKSSSDVTVLLHSTSPNNLDRSQAKTEDSGLFSHSTRASMGSTESYPSSTEYLVSDVVGALANQVLDTIEHELEGKKVDEGIPLEVLSPSRQSTQAESSAHHVCVRLCSLIKAQLVAAHAEIIRRYGIPTPSLTDIVTDGNNEEIIVESVLNSPRTPLSPASTSDVSLNKSQTPGIEEIVEQFIICDSAPSTHNYFLTMLQPVNPPEFFRTVRKELKLLRGGLPPGVWVKNYEDRMDLFSVLIRGPDNTPYEDGLFLFDFQLPAEYPKIPPLCHYISYCCDRLNPNLYEDGKVCVSLLGTWTGKGTEVWGSSSTLLQVLVSIQGLILVPEPYFNEAGYEKQKGSQSGCENSRMYNEMVVLKLVQATTKLLRNPPEVFKDEILTHFKSRASALLKRLENWLALSEAHNARYPTSPMTPSTYRVNAVQQDSSILDLVPPDFPLIPASKGFCLSLKSALDSFKEILRGHT